MDESAHVGSLGIPLLDVNVEREARGLVAHGRTASATSAPTAPPWAPGSACMSPPIPSALRC